MQDLAAFLRTLGAARIAAMGAVTVALIGFFSFLILRVTAPQMTPVFSDLSLQDSASIVKDLDRQGVVYELKGNGSVVLVPRDQVLRIRMRLAEVGLPKGGSIGYEIFDKSDTLGATSFVQNINRLRALEGELARTISALDPVELARVHLVLPERPLFSRDKIEPSASIVLKVRGALANSQVRAIRHLVATAVTGLKPERVSVVDESGRLLADGATGDTMPGANVDERQSAFDKRLRDQVEAIVTSVVGPGRARVQIASEFDFNRITETSDRYDPEGRVTRSSQTREESSASSENAGGQVSVSNELPGTNQRPEQNQGQRDRNSKSEEIVNYEISRTTKTEVIEGGRLKRVSVAVLVDGTYTKNDKGESVYQAREKEEMDRIGALVRTAIGFDQKRGDQVEVVNLRFAEQPTPMISEPAGWLTWLTPTKDDMMRAIELLVTALLGLLVILFVVRPLVRRVIASDAPAAVGMPMLAPAAAGAHGAAPAHGIASGSSMAPPMPSQTSQMIDIAQVQGQVHAQSIQKVGELANRNPNETVSIVRNWLHEPAG